MARAPGDSAVDDLDVADVALSSLANEQRLKLVFALGAACVGGDYGSLRFTELMDGTGLSDSGKLNYHLQELIEHDYVTSTDDGYRLSLRGLKAYQAVQVGFYAEDPEIEPFPIDATHLDCGESLFAEYADQRVIITCQACDLALHRYPLPPGSVETLSRPDLLDALETRFAVDIRSMSRGFCPYCSGHVELELSYEPYDRLDVEEWDAPAPLFWCTHCHWFYFCTINRVAKYHPVVVSFFADRDVDVWETPGWTQAWTVEDRVLSEDPWKIELTYTYDGDSLVVVVDDSLDVIDSEIQSAG